MLDLVGKVVFISGVSIGIGVVVVCVFVVCGVYVVVYYNSLKEEVEVVVVEVCVVGSKVVIIGVDVCDMVVINVVVFKVVEQMGCIDVFINNVGVLVKCVLLEMVIDEFFDEIININVCLVVVFMWVVIFVMCVQGGGNIINVILVVVCYGGGFGVLIYVVFKGFVSIIMCGMVKELLVDKICVNVVVLGVIMMLFQECFIILE